VERENDCADDLLRCLREDAEWLKKNL